MSFVERILQDDYQIALGIGNVHQKGGRGAREIGGHLIAKKRPVGEGRDRVRIVSWWPLALLMGSLVLTSCLI